MAKKKSPVEEEADLNMTPMIDVTFQLLIFFIITLKFKTLEKKLVTRLPTDFGLQSSSDPIEQNFVTVKMRQPPKAEAGRNWRDADKTRIYVNDVKIEADNMREAMTKVRKQLATFHQQAPDALGKIDAGKGVPHKHVVSTLDIFSKESYENVVFVGLSKNFNIVKSDEWWNKVQQGLKLD